MIVQLHIGIDDTDSPKGGCTTYTMALIADMLRSRRIELVDHPYLVRLNPNIPWKTRGNAALALHLEIPDNQVSEVKEIIVETVKGTSQTEEPRTDPAICFLHGPVPDSIREHYRKSLTKVVPIEDALTVAKEAGAEIQLLKDETRGVVGALAAIGADLQTDDSTFEIIAYRTQEKRGTRRSVDPKTVEKMNDRFGDRTFNNLDPETGRILITPHGPDPVLFGIRGKDPETLTEAYRMIDPGEPVERTCIFRSNQGTDAHLRTERSIRSLKQYESGNISGTVVTAPISKRGGHVFLRIQDNGGSIDCAAYKATGQFRNHVMKLVEGDEIRAYGGVRAGPREGQLTFNLEKLEILQLKELATEEMRRCEKCGGSFESMGQGQGLRCRKCGRRKSAVPIKLVLNPRSIGLGRYAPPPRTHRHLTMSNEKWIANEH